MARFHDLEVTDIHKTIRDAVVVTLKPVNGAASEFDFTQGQYLTFRREFEGEELRRSYSICSGKDDGVLQIGIKRVDGGAFSTWANEELKVGDTVNLENDLIGKYVQRLLGGGGAGGATGGVTWDTLRKAGFLAD